MQINSIHLAFVAEAIEGVEWTDDYDAAADKAAELMGAHGDVCEAAARFASGEGTRADLAKVVRKYL